MSALTRFCTPVEVDTDDSTTVLGPEFTTLLWKVFVAIGTHSNPQAPGQLRKRDLVVLMRKVGVICTERTSAHMWPVLEAEVNVVHSSEASRSANKAFRFSSFLRSMRVIAKKAFRRAANEESACELLYLRHLRPHTAEYVDAYEGRRGGSGGGGGGGSGPDVAHFDIEPEGMSIDEDADDLVDLIARFSGGAVAVVAPFLPPRCAALRRLPGTDRPAPQLTNQPASRPPTEPTHLPTHLPHTRTHARTHARTTQGLSNRSSSSSAPCPPRTRLPLVVTPRGPTLTT